MKISNSTARVCVGLALGLLLVSAQPVFAWGDVGHRIVARIAARHLTKDARERLVAILRAAFVDDLQLRTIIGNPNAPQPPVSALEEAMTRMATWPDHMPGGKGNTSRWHFVDIGLFETPAQIDARCGPTCVSERIEKIRASLESGQTLEVTQPDGHKLVFRADRQLRFLIHFMGDIHQPLHAVSNADAGGNCVTATNYEFADNLHSVWDTQLVMTTIAGLSDPAGAIITQFKAEQASAEGETNAKAIAGESFELAKTRIYPNITPKPAPVIPTFIDVSPRECSTEAPAEIRALVVKGPGTFRDATSLRIVRRQLFRAGVRLAAILNELLK